MKRVFLISGLILFSFLPVTGQELNKTEDRLESIRKQIRDLEGKIQSARSEEQNSLDQINKYERQIALTDALIQTLSTQLADLNAEIETARRDLDETENQLAQLKEQYSLYVTKVYKKGSMYDLELIFAAENINQSLVRLRYMRFFSDQRKRDMNNILIKQKQIHSHRLRLTGKLKEHKQVVASKLQEEASLTNQREKMESAVKKARKNLKQFNSALTAQKKEEEKLQSVIAKLIEDEEKRRASAMEKGSSSFKKSVEYESKAPEWEKLNPNFADNKGRFSWPVANGVVVTPYGKIRDNNLKTTKVSNGIDIAVPVGSPVRVIAEGVVARVDFIPGFENIVIIRHNSHYLTVYGQIGELSVKEGDRVNSGSILGRSGGEASSKGPSIHFEVWAGKDHLNPESWLVKQ
ncbi:MAG: peptidoglycan DD-metalloendopeptidase family protein [Bacteroidetes bacterium]|nr:peptidoglycan DD-metalloendopeptidase family protein [Bacteroidota bacterium]